VEGSIPSCRSFPKGKMEVKRMDAKISEAGNGFPDVGEYVYCGNNNTVYRVEKIGEDGGIHAIHQYVANWVWAKVEEWGDPWSVSEEEFEAIMDVEVEILEEVEE